MRGSAGNRLYRQIHSLVNTSTNATDVVEIARQVIQLHFWLRTVINGVSEFTKPRLEPDDHFATFTTAYVRDVMFYATSDMQKQEPASAYGVSIIRRKTYTPR